MAVVCVAQFVVVLDVTVVATALPVVGRSLGFPAKDLHWVITGYTLVFSGFLIPGGRLADVLGRRSAFLLGFSVFVLASVACALAWTPWSLLVARLLQGLGAALLAPAALALLTTMGEPGSPRRGVLGVWTAAAATGGASGWVVGGLLTEYLGWRSVFWVNLPVGLFAVAAALCVVPRSRRTPAQVDLLGAVGVTAALAVLLYGLASAGEEGVLSTSTWVSCLLAVVLTVALIGYERRLAHPLLPASLLGSRQTVSANLTALLLTAATTPAMFLAILFVQMVLELPPAHAAWLFPAFNVAVIAGSLLSPLVLRRRAVREVLTSGFAGIGVGTTLLTTLSAGEDSTTRLLAAFALMGAGLGVASVASTHIGTDAAAPADRGLAGGMLNAAAQVGTALGLALVAPLATAGRSPDLESLRRGFLATCVIAGLGTLVALVLTPPQVLSDQRGDSSEELAGNGRSWALAHPHASVASLRRRPRRSAATRCVIPDGCAAYSRGESRSGRG